MSTTTSAPANKSTSSAPQARPPRPRRPLRQQHSTRNTTENALSCRQTIAGCRVLPSLDRTPLASNFGPRGAQTSIRGLCWYQHRARRLRHHQLKSQLPALISRTGNPSINTFHNYTSNAILTREEVTKSYGSSGVGVPTLFETATRPTNATTSSAEPGPKGTPAPTLSSAPTPNFLC
ncbi:hypothetical protein PG996_016082 [Apiospora saccharicola]|uniref:Uncharacterized protein n=1 Tax=Apiospora saccharicola TaxID=335842 RepID=A0ABR1TQQ0_9PEZI